MASPGNLHCANCIGALSFTRVFLEVVFSPMEACESQQWRLHGDGLHQEEHCGCASAK